MIKNSKIQITQDFKPGIHEGIDIRSVSEKTLTGEEFVLLDICLPEDSIFTVFGIDGYGNPYYCFEPIEKTICDEFCFVHIYGRTDLIPGQKYIKGLEIGTSIINEKRNNANGLFFTGNSYAHHLHFETRFFDKSSVYLNRIKKDPKIYLKYKGLI